MLSVTPQESDTGFELQKRVSWKGIFVREYNCTIGDHPLCSDNLPLSLDWSYRESENVKNIENSSERKSSYKFPKRLSYEDRKKRLAEDNDSVGEEWQFAKPSLESDNTEAKAGDNDIEDSCSQSVIYCRHVVDEDEDNDDDDSVNYFLDWSKFAGFS